MELPHLGKNCEFTSCNQLDFLPFQCSGCGKTFCLNHKSREQHNCTAPEAQHLEFTGERSYPCSWTGCEKRELAPIICHHCELSFCLGHRLQEDHSCIKLPEKAPEVTKTTQHVQQILAQRNIQPRSKSLNPKALQMAAKVALMKMKEKAVGDQGLSERVYFRIILPLESKKLPLHLFFSKVWSVGRVVDYSADKASVTNNNNTSAEKKLCLFHADTGARLPADKKLSELMEDQSTFILNGSTLVLEYTTDATDFLDHLDLYKTQ
ncbi:AN1-type zinc finger protein 1-like [Physella acuta]|uniref:AN1-type zinc finger protein 1-like n=1 Tax=Physella acuta TaxID=109671 RepID=UPI0027DB56CF|nr:AN1-type zinc finger protein 1-like [Physella acuta]